MGVSLERVQNKFACIIGELCNEPVVLSQFAIWLDMRLAEYKAKGSICLECCGDIPKPTWLKGLPLKETEGEIVPLDEGWPPGMLLDDTGQYGDGGLGRRIDHDGHSRRRSTHLSSRQFHPASRRSDNGTPSSSHPTSPRTDLDLTSDHIIIKQEALDHSDNMQTGSHLSDWRKRPSERDYDSTFPSHLKSQRLSSDVSPLNEPLTAIINRSEASESQPNSAIDKLSAMTEQSFNQSITNVDDDDDDIQVEIISGPSSILPSPSSNINPYPGTSSADFSSPIAANSSDLDSSRLSQNDSLMGSDMANASVYRRQRGGEWSETRSGQLVGGMGEQGMLRTTAGPGTLALGITPESTQRNTNHAACLLLKWLREEYPTEEISKIETMDAAVLDFYLEAFFSRVQKRQGGEYSPKSLKALREGLVRYLKLSNYPYSIVHGAEFWNSQQAYKRRYDELHRKRVFNL